MIDLPLPTPEKLQNGDKAGIHKPLPTGPERSEPEETPPAYSQATTSSPSPSRVVSLSRNRQAIAPFSEPINGLQMYTRRGGIRGSWTLNPVAPLVPSENLVQMFLDGSGKKKGWFSSRCAKSSPPTAMFKTRYGGIHATLRIVGESALRSVATIRSATRDGEIVLDLVSIAPMRTAHIDARSRRGSITLLVPRNFCGLVQLSSRHGGVELLPILAASARVIKTVKKQTTILIGDGPMPAVGSDVITDTARLYSRHGRVRLGFSGEDQVVKIPGLMDQAMQFVQKLIGPSSPSHCRVPWK